jgi:hypothetical protein
MATVKMFGYVSVSDDKGQWTSAHEISKGSKLYTCLHITYKNNVSKVCTGDYVNMCAAADMFNAD